jgi:hypothetical protein
MRPANLESIEIRQTQINSYFISRLEVDLQHINYGLDDNKIMNKTSRSNFNLLDIKLAFESLNELNLESVKSEGTGYEYFVYEGLFFNDQNIYKIIFCIHPSDKETTGVITLFRIGEENDTSK